MKEKFEPVIPGFTHMIHGGDYNPDQWTDEPGIWEEDERLMKLAHWNSASIGIFAWSVLEPEEGVYDFSVLDAAMDRIARIGGKAILATPSGARPHWLSQKYPEVLRVSEDRRNMLFGQRENHCYTSPVYREKTAHINRLLAERYKDHPALGMWHISNEFGGECHCEKCQAAFREWLKQKYEGDLERLNHEWWTAFWSHRYTSWEQIESPSSIGDTVIHGLNLDWKRFVTDQTTDFIRNETAPLKEITPNVPVTTNMMGTYPILNYWKQKEALDVISWDAYPKWHQADDVQTASYFGMYHDINRTMLQKPFMLMESTPSIANWHEYSKLKRPGVHKLGSVQAIAHGSDTVQYFQWRKGRGAMEKFHGAVIDHCGHEHTRVFRDVAEVGELLEKLDGIVGTMPECKVAVIYDWENRWALDDLHGLQKTEGRKYEETVWKYYHPFWKRGVNVDVPNAHQDLSGYDLVIAPMLYMTDQETIDRLEKYVAQGGTLIGTYLMGEVNENDLCYMGGFPAKNLKNVFGLWSEEIDTLCPQDRNAIVLPNGKEYAVVDHCEIVHPNTAETLGTYQTDFYAGTPAVCKNSYGKGTAYYIACRDTGEFADDFCAELIEELQIPVAVKDLPEGVSAHTREGGGEKYLFAENYRETAAEVSLDKIYTDMETGETVQGTLHLDGFGVKILKAI